MLTKEMIAAEQARESDLRRGWYRVNDICYNPTTPENDRSWLDDGIRLIMLGSHVGRIGYDN